MLNKYSLNSYHRPSRLLGPEDRAVREVEQKSPPSGAYILTGDRRKLDKLLEGDKCCGEKENS